MQVPAWWPRHACLGGLYKSKPGLHPVHRMTGSMKKKVLAVLFITRSGEAFPSLRPDFAHPHTWACRR